MGLENETQAPETQTAAEPEKSIDDWAKAISAADESDGEEGEGEDVSEDEPEGEAQADESGGESEEEESESDGEDSVDADNDELADFKAKAEKLGFHLDDRSVAPPERVEFRRKMREERSHLAQQREQALAELKQVEEQILTKGQKAIAIQEAVEAADYEGMAKHMGFGSFRDLNKHFLEATSSPQYKQTRALQEKLAQQEREVQEYKAEQARRAQEETRAKAESEWKADIVDNLSTAQDPVIAKMAKHGTFVEQVFAVQQQHYDPSTGSTVDYTTAAAEVVNGAREMYGFLRSVFDPSDRDTVESPSGRASAESPSSGATAGKQSGRKPKKSISQRKTAEAAPAGSLSLDAWAKRLAASD